jgi:gliding motility-associated-like protein
MKALRFSIILIVFTARMFSQNTRDCIGAQPVCNNPNFTFSATPNNGNINELPGTNSTSNPLFNPASPNMGCLLAGENNPQWLLLNITVGGMLEFSFGAAGSPNPQVGLYDWAMWPYTPATCNDIMNDILPPVRCNWNASGVGGTGIGTVPPGGLQGNFEPALPVVAGQQFVICISNFSGVNTVVTFTSTGTAQIGCQMIQANGATVCPNQTALISPTLTNIINPTFTVQPGNLVTNSNVIALSSITTQIFTITAGGVNSNNQPVSASTTIQLTVIPTQVIPILPAHNYCLGQPVAILAPVGFPNYTLSSANGYYSAGVTNSFALGNATPSLAGSYTVQSISANGCLSTGTTQLNVFQAQVPQISGQMVVCQNTQLQLNANVPGAISFTWRGPNAFLLNANSLNIPSTQPVHAGVYTLEAVAAIGATVCVGTKTIDVKVTPVFPVNISPSQTTCIGRALQMNAFAQNAVNYHWTGPNAFQQGAAQVSIPNLQANHAGVYTVHAHFTLNNITCFNSSTTSIFIDQAPTITLQPTYTFCQGSDIKIIPPNGANHYQWNGPNGFILPDTILLIPNAMPVNAGQYTLNVQSKFDCLFSRTLNIHVIPALELKTAPSDLTICKFTEASNTTSVIGGSGNYHYTYLPMHGITHLTGNLAYFSPQESTHYTVSVTDPACPTTKINSSFWVVVRNLPHAEIASDKRDGCEPMKVKLQVAVNSPSSTVLWNIEAGKQSTASTLEHVYIKAGTYQPRVTVTDVHGCVATHSAGFVIQVRPKPIADFIQEPEEVSLVNNLVKFTPLNQNGQTLFSEWFIGEQPAKKIGNTVEFEFEKAGLQPVLLIITNSFNCKDTVLKYIDVKEDFLVYIPNTFTPNGDGLNDLFGPVSTGLSENDYSFTIYNRWGELIYQSNKPGEAWDGKVSGKEAITGVYTYKLLCRPYDKVKMKEVIGSVYLMR